MKITYKKKKLIMLLKEYPLMYIYCPEKNNSTFLLENNIKSIKFKNTLLKSYNKNLFNGVVLLIYGRDIKKNINELKNILGLFCLNENKLNYFISFNKYLNILIYFKTNLCFNPLLNILMGPLFWFLLKI
jgi:hypothetical protein